MPGVVLGAGKTAMRKIWCSYFGGVEEVTIYSKSGDNMCYEKKIKQVTEGGRGERLGSYKLVGRTSPMTFEQTSERNKRESQWVSRVRTY